jgi:hypothetical protein
MGFAAPEAALEHGEGLAAEGVMAGSDTDTLDVRSIQPCSMVVVVCGGTSGRA